MSPRWDYHDAAHLIPVDRQAERTTAGIAIVSSKQAHVIARMTERPMFHDRVLYEIVVAADGLTDDLTDGQAEWDEAGRLGDHRLVVHGAQARAEAIASVTGIEMALLVKLAVERETPVFTASQAERLKAAAIARREHLALVEQLGTRGVDVGWLVNLDARLSSIAGALLRAATGMGAVINGDGPEADVIDALLDAGRYVGVGRDEIAQAVLAATEGEPR